MAGPEVTVVVPVRDGAHVIGACLDALLGQLGAPQFSVVVVDNGSADATAAVARGHPLRPTVIEASTRGSYAARNAGIAVATGDVVAFTDADCVPESGWLAAGCAALDDADLVGGRVQIDAASVGAVASYDRATYLDQESYVTSQGFAATANLFVRSEVFTRVGPFDESLQSGGDMELCRRATAAGFRLRYAAEALVLHAPRTTYGELWQLHRRLGAGWAALARRGLRAPWWRDPALRWPTFAMVAEQAAAGVPPARRRSLLAPHLTARTARWVGRLTGR